MNQWCVTKPCGTKYFESLYDLLTIITPGTSSISFNDQFACVDFMRYVEPTNTHKTIYANNYVTFQNIFFVNISIRNRKQMKKHELKWRYVNAEITCRPITGIYYKEFIKVFNS